MVHVYDRSTLLKAQLGILMASLLSPTYFPSYSRRDTQLSNTSHLAADTIKSRLFKPITLQLNLTASRREDNLNCLYFQVTERAALLVGRDIRSKVSVVKKNIGPHWRNSWKTNSRLCIHNIYIYNYSFLLHQYIRTYIYVCVCVCAFVNACACLCALRV